MNTKLRNTDNECIPAYGYGYANQTWPKNHAEIREFCYEGAQAIAKAKGSNYTCLGDVWCT